MLELLRKRRSIRKFQDRSVEPDKVEILKEALLRAPSSKGLGSQEYILVSDPKLIKELSLARPHGSAFLAGASLAIVFLGNEETIDVWIEDASLATMIGHLTAASLGLGSCWIQVRNRPHDESRTAEAYIKELLDIPDPLRVLSMLAVGYPAETKDPVPFQSLHQEKIHINRF